MAELFDNMGKIDKAIMTTGEQSDVSIVLHGPDEVSSPKRCDATRRTELSGWVYSHSRHNRSRTPPRR